MEEEVKKLRAEKLKKYQVERIAEFEDRLDTVETAYKEEVEKIKQRIEDIKNLKYVPSQEGSPSIYNY